MNEINNSDFFIFEISNEILEELSQTQPNSILQPFFGLKEKKHYQLSQCSNCHKESTLNYTCQCKHTWFCSMRCFDEYSNASKHKCVLEAYSKEILNMNEKSLKGVVGIKNLGNTCYMNAAIQCLSNIYEISRYFISKLIKSKGEIFKQFTSTLIKLHYGSDKTISIHSLRNVIGKKYSMVIKTLIITTYSSLATHKKTVKNS